MNTTPKIRSKISSATLYFIPFIISSVLLGGCSDDSTSAKTVLGKWRASVVVPPSTQVFVNMLTFSGEENLGTFVDQNDHTGTWVLKGDSVTWNIENVPNLTNTFTGKISEDFRSMTGKNFGLLDGDPFAGTWPATKE